MYCLCSLSTAKIQNARFALMVCKHQNAKGRSKVWPTESPSNTENLIKPKMVRLKFRRDLSTPVVDALTLLIALAPVDLSVAWSMRRSVSWSVSGSTILYIKIRIVIICNKVVRTHGVKIVEDFIIIDIYNKNNNNVCRIYVLISQELTTRHVIYTFQ